MSSVMIVTCGKAECVTKHRGKEVMLVHMEA